MGSSPSEVCWPQIAQKGARATRCVMREAGRVRNALSHGPVSATERGVHNALCHQGGVCAAPCVTRGLPVHNACHVGACAQRGACAQTLCHGGGGKGVSSVFNA